MTGLRTYDTVRRGEVIFGTFETKFTSQLGLPAMLNIICEQNF